MVSMLKLRMPNLTTAIMFLVDIGLMYWLLVDKQCLLPGVLSIKGFKLLSVIFCVMYCTSTVQATVHINCNTA